MTTLQKISCEVCSVSLWRRRGRVNENRKLGHNFYCSRACEYKYKTRKVLTVCENPGCGRSFLRGITNIITYSYCSRSCAVRVNNRKFPKRRANLHSCAHESCGKIIIVSQRFCSRSCYALVRRSYTGEELIGLLREKCVLLG